MGTILPIITGILLLYADFQSAKKLKKNVHGHLYLRLNKSYKWVGFVCCFIGSFLLNTAISHWNKEIAVLAPIAILAFFAMGITLLICYYHYEIVFNDKRIIATNWRGKKQKMEWTAIENIKFNRTSGYLKLYTQLQKILVWQHSTGFVEFLRAMESKTSFTKEELRIPFKL